MTVIRLPSWGELLAPETPWALLLRSGSAGLWLLRSTAEEVGDLDATVVAAMACTTSADVFTEWASALELEDEPPSTWDEFAAALVNEPWCDRAACAILVSDAHRLLESEPGRLPTLLEALGSAASRLEREGRALRVIFQSRFDTVPERVDVFREFALGEIA